MNRLLIVITRMYAEKGDDKKDGGDEFVTVWGLDPVLEDFAFECSAEEQDYHVLVIHGYDYPGDLQKAIDRATAAVDAGLAESKLGAKLSGLKVGFIFHLRPYWDSSEKDQFAKAMQEYLTLKGIDPAFVKKFSHDTPIERALAPQCRATPHDFSQGFIETWNFFFLPAKMAETKHSINSLLNVLDQDLQWWKLLNFEDSDEARRVFSQAREHDPVVALREAKKIVLGDNSTGAGNAESIKSIAEQVARDKPGQRQAIEQALNAVVTLFGDPVYAEVERTLSILSNTQNKRDTDVLRDLRQQMQAQGSKSFLEWYYELDTALKKLRYELTGR